MDYVSFVGAFLEYLRLCCRGRCRCRRRCRDCGWVLKGDGLADGGEGEDDDDNDHDHDDEDEDDDDDDDDGSSIDVELVCGGYSYGALVTMRLPSVEEILMRFGAGTGAGAGTGVGTAEDRIQRAVRAACYGGDGQVEEGIGQLPVGGVSLVSVAYLLVSPVLPPLAWLFGGRGVVEMGGGDRGVRVGEGAGEDEGRAGQESGPRSQTLAIVGENDGYTSPKAVKKWTRRTRSAVFAEVPGASHFWVEDRVMEGLKRRIEEWID